MYRRPDYVAVAGVILCLLGGFAVFGALVTLPGSDHARAGADSPSVGAIVALVGAVMMLVSGINILQGRNWARWLYLAFVAGFLVYDALFLSDIFYTLVPALVIRLIIVVLLFLPDANRYFGSNSRRR